MHAVLSFCFLFLSYLLYCPPFLFFFLPSLRIQTTDDDKSQRNIKENNKYATNFYDVVLVVVERESLMTLAPLGACMKFAHAWLEQLTKQIANTCGYGGTGYY
ncbi:hypothetical protein B0F90DRAFT_1748161, partial [Multifurca ochricompacta]